MTSYLRSNINSYLRPSNSIGIFKVFLAICLRRYIPRLGVSQQLTANKNSAENFRLVDQVCAQNTSVSIEGAELFLVVDYTGA